MKFSLLFIFRIRLQAPNLGPSIQVPNPRPFIQSSKPWAPLEGLRPSWSEALIRGLAIDLMNSNHLNFLHFVEVLPRLFMAPKSS